MENRGQNECLTSRYTPGPWKIGPLIEGGIRGDRRHVYVDIFGAGRKLARISAYGRMKNSPFADHLEKRGKEIRFVSEAEVKANARRLVAAVNACDGISTKTLEVISGADGKLEIRKKGKPTQIPFRRLFVALASVGGIPTGALEDGVLTTIVRLAAIGLRTLERGPSEDARRFTQGQKDRALCQARTCISRHGRAREGANV